MCIKDCYQGRINQKFIKNYIGITVDSYQYTAYMWRLQFYLRYLVCLIFNQLENTWNTKKLLQLFNQLG